MLKHIMIAFHTLLFYTVYTHMVEMSKVVSRDGRYDIIQANCIIPRPGDEPCTPDQIFQHIIFLYNVTSYVTLYTGMMYLIYRT